VSFLRGLLAARSHLAFLVGLAAAVAVIRATSRLADAAPAGDPPAERARLAERLPLRGRAPLTARDRELARAAWSYFERNTDERSGLAQSVRGYPSTTMWEAGSQLLAILAAEDLRVVSREEARRRLERALAALEALPLCEGLPNKAYDTRTLEMVRYDNAPAPGGIGWSALDVGRVLAALTLVARRVPELAPAVGRVVARWDLDALVDGAALRGATRRADGVLETYQEGRLGYEQYAAKALLGWGVPAAAALDYRTHTAFRDVSGRAVPHDDRRPRDHGGTHNAVLSEPWVLDGLEFGLDAVTAALARAVLAAQERRFAATGRLTAVSEDALDRPPGFAYSAVLNGPDAWTAFSPDGTPAPQDLTFSAKAAIGWAALFGGSYPDRLLEAAAALRAPEGGLYAGRYDATGEVNRALSLNTNAVVLEALAYRVHGPSFRPAARPAGGLPHGAEARQ
jgi:hypothetical protein